jgi:predicted dehydrogenase
MKLIKSAIIGTGFMGAAHYEAVRRIPGVEVVSVSASSPEIAEAFRAENGIDCAVADWREIVDDPEIEVVHNCTPNNVHFEINLALVRAGKHVISEKPLAVSSEQSQELVDAAQEAGVVTATNFNYRSYPIIRHVREMVQSGKLGNPLLIHGQYIQDWLLFASDYNWRLDSEQGGASRAVADIGSHWCDLVQFVSGRRIESVCADLFTIHPTRRKPAETAATFGQGSGDATDVSVDTEDGATILLRFEGGVRGAVTISQVSAGRKNHLAFELDCSERAVAWNQERPEELWIGRRDGPNEVLTKNAALMEAGAAEYAHYPGGHPEGYPDAFKNMFRNVYRYIADGRKPGVHQPDFPTFEDGHRSVLLVESVLRSHAERAWVDVPSIIEQTSPTTR